MTDKNQQETFEVIHSKNDIQKNIKQLAEKINFEYKNRKPILVCVLNGAVLFYSDLVKKLNIKIKMDFIGFSSYHNNKQTDEIIINKDLKYDVEGQELIIVEDMIDSGNTMKFAIDYFQNKKVKSIKIVALIASKQVTDKLNLDNFEYFYEKKPNTYYVGYGLDNKEFDRQLEDICYIKNSNQIQQLYIKNEQQNVGFKKQT